MNRTTFGPMWDIVYLQSDRRSWEVSFASSRLVASPKGEWYTDTIIARESDCYSVLLDGNWPVGQKTSRIKKAWAGDV